ncbi:DUF2442 domain-containing protein [Hymenobacter baengnokdamensis]|uniref:DUF2442 domain-containing protein n=1 Tax=Hymenobacter baengnokdamensis TaxID=2615203 RepID=UPI0012470586|nr:DUF2442 domain-containing protein [Hymenobacter baengnokdamensis]
MSTLTRKPETVSATTVWFDDSKLYVRLADGREVGVPIDWYPRLRDASEEARNNWRLIGRGQGIHWEDVDEDLLVAGFLKA